MEDNRTINGPAKYTEAEMMQIELDSYNKGYHKGEHDFYPAVGMGILAATIVGVMIGWLIIPLP